MMACKELVGINTSWIGGGPHTYIRCGTEHPKGAGIVLCKLHREQEFAAWKARQVGEGCND